MAEAIVMGIFLLILVVLQKKEEKNIIIFSKNSLIKRGIAIVLAILLVTIFWQSELSNQLKIIIFASLILFIGFTKEGLAKDHLVKFGLLSGKYSEYQYIQIEKISNEKTFVSFYKKKNNRFSLMFESSIEDLEKYFEELNLEVAIFTGEITEENSLKS